MIKCLSKHLWTLAGPLLFDNPTLFSECLVLCLPCPNPLLNLLYFKEVILYLHISVSGREKKIKQIEQRKRCFRIVISHRLNYIINEGQMNSTSNKTLKFFNFHLRSKALRLENTKEHKNNISMQPNLNAKYCHSHSISASYMNFFPK